MQFLTTDQIKQQCRLDLNDSTEDEYLAMIGEASELAVESHLNRKLYTDAVPDDDSNGLVINNSVRMAMLLMVGQLYENREATISGAHDEKSAAGL